MRSLSIARRREQWKLAPTPTGLRTIPILASFGADGGRRRRNANSYLFKDCAVHAWLGYWVRSAKKVERSPRRAVVGGSGHPTPTPEALRRPPVPKRSRIGLVRRGLRKGFPDANPNFFGVYNSRSWRGDWVRLAKNARFAARRVRRIEKERGGEPGPTKIRRRWSDDLRKQGPPASYDPRRTAFYFMILGTISELFAGRDEPGRRSRHDIRGWRGL